MASYGLRKFLQLSWWSIVMFFATAQHHHQQQQQDSQDNQSRCYDDKGRPQRCIPEFVNAAFNVRVEATNTCGTRGPTEYCLQTGATGAKKSCEVCDASVPHLAHPPEYLTDFNNNDNQTWWQSETMFEHIQYPNQVNLTLHLGKSFDITYVRLKFHTSRPESFAIYKRTSEDSPWVTYQYYSATCRGTYGIPDRSYVSQDDQTRALCTSEFSDISPLTGGNVAFSTLEGRPSAYDFENSPVLQEWVTATDIRITLDRVNTFGDEIFGDPKVLKSYYYGVSDFAVGGRCKCNGHSSECILDGGQPWERSLACRCVHNTAGKDCGECQPFYNDQPWGRATAADVHECKPCNCNGRSNKCYFDQELWRQTGHGGHCLDCIDNTDGVNCERCKENFYEREDGRCVPCNCDPIGSRSLQCNNRGQCQCKPGVEGQRCNRCAANFYDFTSLGCRPCGCNVAGSIDNTPTCDHVTGVCSCKDNVEGQHCGQCKPGYFDLQTGNEFGCLACFCFGHSSICRSASGYTAFTIDSTFARDAERWKAVDHKGKEVPFQYNAVTQNIVAASTSRDPVYFLAPGRYLGDHRTSYNQFLSFTLRISDDDPKATLEDVLLEGGGLSISLPIFGQGNPLPSVSNQNFKFRLHEHSAYGWNPRFSSHDFMSILSNITALKIKATYSAASSGMLDNVVLETAQRSPLGQEATWMEMCTCPEGYVGQFCESCAPGYRHEPAGGGKFARCVPCNCNGHADLCDTESGRCICQDNTAGDNCEFCASGYYGNALIGTYSDCQPCPCPGGGACVILPDEQVACLQCPEGYAGHRCHLCVDGYFGNPSGSYGDAQSCRKCDCNENVDSNAVGNCDRTTGECLKCIYNTGGRHCEKCLPGFYGDALALPKGDCKACNCYRTGTSVIDPSSYELVCDYGTGQCPCKQYVEGKHCDTCAEGFWNIASGEGCESCRCDPVGSLNYLCDITSGQCNCRPGVTGQHCDQCKPHHYGFSIEGCKTCDCDHIGSISLQCDAFGQCDCRENVEGRRCERCKENKYDKAVGCVDCPPCYNLVQEAANSHREKLAELQELLNAIKDNPQIIDDVEFLRQLAEVQGRVDKLLEDAQSASGSDGNLVGKLKELHQRLNEVKKTLGVVHDRIEGTNLIGEQGKRNITIAEEVIQRAQDALANARKFLETNGVKALEKAIERSNKFGQQSARMSEIAREARHLAEEQEQEANEIESLAQDALNASSEAYERARQAIDLPRETANKIYRLNRDLDDVESQLEETEKLAEQARQEANKTYSGALDIYTDATSIVIPDVRVTEMKEEAEDIIEKAREIQGQANDIMQNHEDLLDRVDQQIKDAEGLLDEGKRQQQLSDEMFADTDAALHKAKKAVADGEKTLEEAKQTLDTLRGFDQLVQDSKEKSDEAQLKVPAIIELIEDAENKTAEASDALSGAQQDAEAARDIAQEAERIAEQASRDANDTREEAGQTKAKAEELKEKTDELGEKVGDTDDRLKTYESQAEKDEDLVQAALEQANQAKTSANEASTKVTNALETVEDILRALEGLDEIDSGLLDELEQKLDEAEQKLREANFEPRMAELRNARDLQHQWMRSYDEEVAQAAKDVQNVRAIKESLPEKCYRRVVLEP